jgi:hypothetical protein
MTFIANYNSSFDSIDSVKSLLESSCRLSNVGRPGGIYFRGQANGEWGLRPSIGRLNIRYGGRVLSRFTHDDERNLLHRFRRYTYSHLNRSLNEWEALFLARHHNLPVRMLDWSSNPLVALYAACLERDFLGKDGSIWSIRRIDPENNDLNVFTTSLSPLDVRGLKILYPFYGSARMTAQSAVFTIQDDPWRDMETYFPHQLGDEHFDVVELIRFKVPASAKPKALDDLERLGINHRTLFPDLDGVAQGLWQTIVLRSGVNPDPRPGESPVGSV